MKPKYTEEEKKARKLQAAKRYRDNPENKKKASEYKKKRMSDPEIRKAATESDRKRKLLKNPPKEIVNLTEEQKLEARRKRDRDYENRPEVKERRKLARQSEEAKKREKDYVAKNIEKVREYKSNYKKRPEAKEKANKKFRERLKEEPQLKLSRYGRKRRWDVLKKQNAKKKVSYKDSIGCSIEFLVSYIESLWLPNMSWDNYGHGKGKWVIDEIKPCASFNLQDPEEYKKCFHYSNCQPLWFMDNAVKGSFYEGVKHSHKNKNK